MTTAERKLLLATALPEARRLQWMERTARTTGEKDDRSLAVRDFQRLIDQVNNEAQQAR